MFLPDGAPGETLEERVAAFLDLDPDGEVMRRLAWLGLFSGEPCGEPAGTAAEALARLFTTRLALPPDGRDMVILMHCLEVRYPDEGGRRERVRSVLVHRGDPGGWTAMARTVGLPASLVTRLLLSGELPLTGAHIPTHPAVYEPVLGRLEEEGLRFEEDVEELAPAAGAPARSEERR